MRQAVHALAAAFRARVHYTRRYVAVLAPKGLLWAAYGCRAMVAPKRQYANLLADMAQGFLPDFPKGWD